jgi:hypothetical protein
MPLRACLASCTSDHASVLVDWQTRLLMVTWPQAAVVNNDDLRPTSPLTELFKHDFWGTPIASERSHKYAAQVKEGRACGPL